MHRLALAALILLGPAVVTACSDQAGSPERLDALTTAAPPQVTQSFAMPVHATTFTSVSSCDNSPGPYITIEGGFALGGLGSRFTFTNNVKGTHTYSSDAHVDITAVPNGQNITIPKQPVLGGVGGNPFIWVQLEDGNGNALTDEVFVGRCVQGLGKNVAVDFSSLANALANVSISGDCQNNPGPFITLSGDLTVQSGLTAKLIFRNNDNPVGGPHQATADAVVNVQLVPPGQTITFNKQPVLGGVGGNPWIWFQFLNGQGVGIGSQVLLGRCVQLES